MAAKKAPNKGGPEPTEAEKAALALGRRAYLSALRLASNADLVNAANNGGLNEDLVAELERRVAEQYAPKSP